jgi:undecaprenyl-phosphate 4-deoxy-4-formamido-L-arabinose transferase
MKTLSIVIPVFNSEKTVGHLSTSLINLYASSYRLEIVLVNDGSRDSSDVVCRNLHEHYPDTITYLKLAKNFGEHSAVMAGLNHASGEYCVVMDDDFQNPPSEVGKLVEELSRGYDVVYAQYDAKRDAWYRNFGSRFNNMMAGMVLKKPKGLYLSSFKALNRFLVKEIVKHAEPEPYLDGIILRITDNIGAVRIEHAVRASSRSGYTFGKLIGLWGNMVMSYSMVPLRLIGMIGLLLVVVGAVYGAIKAYDDVGMHARLTDYESLMFANVVFRGMILLAISIVGEYIGRLYLSFSRDPQFVVRERLSSTRKASDHIAYLKER